jgi:hypothetical protein
VAAARYFQRMRIFSAVFLAWLSFAAIAADVYRWVDSQGVVHYSDKPQAPNDKPVALPHLQTYAAGSGAPAFTAAETGSPAKTAAAPISISSPAPDETIRDAEGKFTVTVAANPGPGEGLVYFLDGVAQNSQPTPSTALLFSGVERGQHSISAALIGGDGEQLARSADVTINMKPPSVRH